MLNKKAYGGIWPELGGWVLILVILLVVVIVIYSGYKLLDWDFVKILGG
ncbi:hypothetical protein HYX10_05520 [Candidatus Woesearchaeota archaeon]|nr:hypothetical protein [Candidatus Woesearchaeota archaeon]